MESHTARLLPDSSPYREYILSLGQESAAVTELELSDRLMKYHCGPFLNILP
jgi:hypothetical protein